MINNNINVKKKTRFDIKQITRFVIQLGFFIFLPDLFVLAFNGVKYIAQQMFGREMIAWNSFLTTLVILLVATFLFGRIFCGYACAFGSIGDWLYTCSSFIQKKIRKKVFKLPSNIIRKLNYCKYVVLMGILALCLTGTYGTVSNFDPWGIFASFIAGNFDIGGKWIAFMLLVLIAIGMCLTERFFCQFLCPMGAIFALMPMLPFFTFNKKNENCIQGCTLCVRTCPAAISLGNSDSRYNDCFQCGKCRAKCPKKNINRINRISPNQHPLQMSK